MARARNIKPGIFKNEVLGVADPLLTILFESLWCLADREGRIEDRPLRIKAETFPYRENLDVNGYLTELQRMKFICRYEVDGGRFIQVLNFHKHQNPHKTEKPSTIPEMPVKSDSCAITEVAPLNNGSRPADLLIPDSLIPDSLVLIPDAGIPLKPASPAVDLAEQFEEVWAAYPKRAGSSKADSLKAWKARIKAGATPDEILDGVWRYAKYVAANRTEDRFIKQPQTFFGPGDHFRSEWSTGAPAASHLGRAGQATAANAQRLLDQDDDHAA